MPIPQKINEKKDKNFLKVRKFVLFVFFRITFAFSKKKIQFIDL
jgi:hypothetical protein